MNKYFIVVAGGKGVRMGKDIPKQFIALQGLPILMHTISRLHQSVPDARIILVLPQKHIDMWNELVCKHSFDIPVQIAFGGDTRFDSVKNGLELIEEEDALVAIHDGVRPFVSEQVVRRCFEEVVEKGAVIPVVRPVDSIRFGDEDGGSKPIDRDRCYMVQTPQTFRFSLLRRAYQQPYRPSFTDDASVIEAIPAPVFLMDGNRENIKITTAYDLMVAEALASI